MYISKLNPVGAGLILLGCLLGIACIFMPIYQDTAGFAGIQDNSLVQAQGIGTGLAIRYVVCSIAAVLMLWRYQATGRSGWGAMVWGLVLAVGAIRDISHSAYFELVDVSGQTDFTATAHPGIAWYMAIAGGALIALGGVLVWRQSVPVSKPLPAAPPPPITHPRAPSSGSLFTESVESPVAADSRERETKRCPSCAEDVKAEAARCRFCGFEFSPVETT